MAANGSPDRAGTVDLTTFESASVGAGPISSSSAGRVNAIAVTFCAGLHGRIAPSIRGGGRRRVGRPRSGCCPIRWSQARRPLRVRYTARVAGSRRAHLRAGGRCRRRSLPMTHRRPPGFIVGLGSHVQLVQSPLETGRNDGIGASADRRRAMMVAGGAAYERGQVRRSAGPAGRVRRGRSRRRPPPPPPAPAGAGRRGPGELERLASLHDSGTLSDDEFAAAKAKILGTWPSTRLRERGRVMAQNDRGRTHRAIETCISPAAGVDAPRRAVHRRRQRVVAERLLAVGSLDLAETWPSARCAFSDVDIKIDSLDVVGNRVSAEFRVSATFSGPSSSSETP